MRRTEVAHILQLLKACDGTQIIRRVYFNGKEKTLNDVRIYIKRSAMIGNENELLQCINDDKELPDQITYIDTHRSGDLSTAGEVLSDQDEHSTDLETGAEAPLQFKDAAGRDHFLPFERYRQWSAMAAFVGITLAADKDLGHFVQKGVYDIIRPSGKYNTAISEEEWESEVRPGMSVAMELWPIGITYKDMHRLAPFDRCRKWEEMVRFIDREFGQNYDFEADSRSGSYRLIGPRQQILSFANWEATIEPGMTVTLSFDYSGGADVGEEADSGEDDGHAIARTTNVLKPVLLRVDDLNLLSALDFDKCRRWEDMKVFIHQQLSNIDDEKIADRVRTGQFYLATSDWELITPWNWERIVRPGLPVRLSFDYTRESIVRLSEEGDLDAMFRLQQLEPHPASPASRGEDEQAEMDEDAWMQELLPEPSTMREEALRSIFGGRPSENATRGPKHLMLRTRSF